MYDTISEEKIRQNWNEYKDKVTEEKYESLWNDWYKKFGIDKNDAYAEALKLFITDTKFQNKTISTVKIEKVDERTLKLKGTDSNLRKMLHKLCDKIGLHHMSKTVQETKRRQERYLYIYKPKVWLWEYSEKNPYSESSDYYTAKEKMKNEKLSRMYCCECSVSGLEATLCSSVYMRGLYCEDCLDCISDGDNGVLNDHKFEPV